MLYISLKEALKNKDKVTELFLVNKGLKSIPIEIYRSKENPDKGAFNNLKKLDLSNNKITLNNAAYKHPYADPDLIPKQRICITCMNRNHN